MWRACTAVALFLFEREHVQVSAFVSSPAAAGVLVLPPLGGCRGRGDDSRRCRPGATARAIAGGRGVLSMTTSSSTDISSPYQPDRDVDTTAYESEQAWQLKYHDIKTRRDAADARAKVRAALVCVRVCV